MALTLASALAAASPALSAQNNDAAFIQAALKSGTAEIKEASIQADSTDSYVRDFANKMVSDHSSANRELLALANELHVKVPNGSAPQDSPTFSPAPINANAETVSKSSPAAYFKNSIADHKSAIALFKQEAASGSNAKVRAFAQKTLPILESHLTLAEKDVKIEKSLKH